MPQFSSDVVNKFQPLPYMLLMDYIDYFCASPGNHDREGWAPVIATSRTLSGLRKPDSPRQMESQRSLDLYFLIQMSRTNLDC